MSVSLSPKGKNSSALLHLENDGKAQIAVSLMMTQRIMDKSGKEKHPDASDLFLLFPDQVILAPKERRTVKLKWLGPANITHEQAYRIIAEQLPIELDAKKKAGANIKILLKYIGAIYITPDNTKSNVLVEDAFYGKKDKLLHIIVNNSGSKHQLLHSLKVKLTAKESKTSSVTLTKKDLKGMDGENILVNTPREFILPWPKKLSPGKIDATVHFDK